MGRTIPYIMEKKFQTTTQIFAHGLSFNGILHGIWQLPFFERATISVDFAMAKARVLHGKCP